MMEFDFQKYIQSRKSDRVVNGERAFRDYAFARDVKVLKTLDRTRFVGLAMKATARLERTWLKDEVLERATRVGPGASPEVRELCHDVARHLGMATPNVYLSSDLEGVRAVAVEVEGRSFVLVDRSAPEDFTDAEMMFLLGQQFGHMQNGHTRYLTCQLALEHRSGQFMGWLVKPAQLALGTWRRLGDVTADRAGLLACRDLEAAESALHKLFPDVDPEGDGAGITIDDLIGDDDEEGDDAQDDTSEVDDDDDVVDAAAERASYTLRVRLRALRAFSQSEIYRLATGLSGGDPLTDVDKEVEGSLRLL